MMRWPVQAGAARETFWRSLQTMNATRVVIAIVLLGYLSIDSRGDPYPSSSLCLIYLLMSVLFAFVTIYWRRRFLLQLSVHVAVDVLAISLLYLSQGGAQRALGLLFLVPLAGAAILAPLVLALFSASLVTLFMLGEAFYGGLTRGGELALMQPGLYGAAFLSAVLVVNRLAAKLIGHEELAIKRGIDLEIQHAINRIVIADVGDGILVCDRDGRVFAGNPVAQRMLGLTAAGTDPLAAKDAAKRAVNVRTAATRWLTEHIAARRKPTTERWWRRFRPGCACRSASRPAPPSARPSCWSNRSAKRLRNARAAGGANWQPTSSCALPGSTPRPRPASAM